MVNVWYTWIKSNEREIRLLLWSYKLLMALIKILALIIYKKNGIYIIILLFIRKFMKLNIKILINLTLFIVTTLENW